MIHMQSKLLNLDIGFYKLVEKIKKHFFGLFRFYAKKWWIIDISITLIFFYIWFKFIACLISNRDIKIHQHSKRLSIFYTFIHTDLS